VEKYFRTSHLLCVELPGFCFVRCCSCCCCIIERLPASVPIDKKSRRRRRRRRFFFLLYFSWFVIVVFPICCWIGRKREWDTNIAGRLSFDHGPVFTFFFFFSYWKKSVFHEDTFSLYTISKEDNTQGTPKITETFTFVYTTIDTMESPRKTPACASMPRVVVPTDDGHWGLSVCLCYVTI
jgi:hypothetical protein